MISKSAVQTRIIVIASYNKSPGSRRGGQTEQIEPAVGAKAEIHRFISTTSKISGHFPARPKTLVQRPIDVVTGHRKIPVHVATHELLTVRLTYLVCRNATREWEINWAVIAGVVADRLPIGRENS